MGYRDTLLLLDNAAVGIMEQAKKACSFERYIDQEGNFEVIYCFLLCGMNPETYKKGSR